jgi:hypothetical protein
MLKRIGIPVIALAAMLSLFSPHQASAATRFGVYVGGPGYYPYPAYQYQYYPAPYPDYYAYPPVYRYYGWRHHERHERMEHRRHEWREHERGRR